MRWYEYIGLSVLCVYGLCGLFVFFYSLFFRAKSKLPLGLSKKVSILIPFRNEEENIVKCLEGINAQEFSKEKFELVLIDDHSLDDSVNKALNYLQKTDLSFRIIQLHEHDLQGKKQAIIKGVEEASGEIIITRDADSYTNSPHWLSGIASAFEQNNCDLLILPVFLTGNNFIQRFQQFENVTMHLFSFAFTGIKLPFVCSGANLAYKKECFLVLKPYQNNIRVSSGDDMFLLQSFLKNKLSVKVDFDPALAVHTSAESSFNGFIGQRIRWISKGKHIHIVASQLMAVLLVLTNIILLALIVSSFIHPAYLKICLFALLFKCAIDFLLVTLGSAMYKQKTAFGYFFPAFLFSVVYTPLISVISLFVKNRWKQRSISL